MSIRKKRWKIHFITNDILMRKHSYGCDGNYIYSLGQEEEEEEEEEEGFSLIRNNFRNNKC